MDTSAIVAILRDEPEKDRFVDAILAGNPRLMSAVSFQEAGMVIAGRHGDATAWEALDALLARLHIEIVAHDAALAGAARTAFLRYGKGRHPSGLNFGDCAAYALAQAHDVPLLFKGDDFARTDIVAAATSVGRGIPGREGERRR